MFSSDHKRPVLFLLKLYEVYLLEIRRSNLRSTCSAALVITERNIYNEGRRKNLYWYEDAKCQLLIFFWYSIENINKTHYRLEACKLAKVLCPPHSPCLDHVEPYNLRWGRTCTCQVLCQPHPWYHTGLARIRTPYH